LLESIRRFNTDKLSTYVSVPAVEATFFKQRLSEFKIELLHDEEIVASNPNNNLDLYRSLPGGVQQQIVKAEFWRKVKCLNYLCIDSDCKFIRPFKLSDFLWDSHTPYTVMDEGHEFLQSILKTPRAHIIDEFNRGGVLYRDLFGRTGRVYSFGPMPVIWSSKVWQSLDEQMLQPRGWSTVEALRQFPSEIPWYGEALLKFKAIELRPCQPLFKVYHYAREYDRDRTRGIGLHELSKIFLGVVYQSSWERSMDWPSESGGLGSVITRRIKRVLGRI
jgi:Family of unknown function (DUF6492)